MSRADKTLSKLIYEITLDETNSKVVSLKVTTLCAQKVGGMPVDRSKAFTSAPHVAFTATYRFTERNGVERFPVPQQAAKLLK